MEKILCKGFSFSGVVSGLKKNGHKDLGLIYSDVPAGVAGAFTRNRVQAAPVLLDRERIKKGFCRAVIANSGSANCCTGVQGMKDAVSEAKLAADGLNISEDQVLVASTGVIGKPLALEKIESAVPELVKALSPEGINDFAQAIMTTDTVPKIVSKKGKIGGSGFTITGTGILTAKPDNVFVRFTVKSEPSVNLKAAEVDVSKKVEFLIRGICREFKLKKENFTVSGAGTQIQERTKKGASANDRFDDEGNRLKSKSYKNTAKKTVVINNLKDKKQAEIMDILDAAAKYGGAPIAINDMEDTAAESVSVISEGLTGSKLFKGATPAKITENIQNPVNQLINYHLNEETLKKLMKDAKAAAMLEVKQKYSKVTAKIKIKEEEFDIDITEDNNVNSDEEGLLTLKTEVTVAYKKSAVKEN